MLRSRIKNSITKTEPFGHRAALSYAVSISLVINLMEVIGVSFGREMDILDNSVYYALYARFFLLHLCSNILVFYLLFLFDFNRVRRGRRHKWLEMVVGGVLIVLVVSPLSARLQWAILGDPDFDVGRFVGGTLIKDVVSSFVIVLITSNIYLGFKREQAVVANQKLREESMRARYEALKNQLDPHFLFNSLNTLSGLIGMDDDKAQEYVGDLSSLFRYTLNSKSVCTLDDELSYVDTYVSLLRIRYGDNLSVDYDVDDSLRSRYVMSVSLQPLVENAVKHNVISNANPLRVEIRTTGHDTVEVRNLINRRAGNMIGGVGLANLSARCNMLFGRDIRISDADGVFSVEVPLADGSDGARLHNLLHRS